MQLANFIFLLLTFHASLCHGFVRSHRPSDFLKSFTHHQLDDWIAAKIDEDDFLVQLQEAFVDSYPTGAADIFNILESGKATKEVSFVKLKAGIHVLFSPDLYTLQDHSPNRKKHTND